VTDVIRVLTENADRARELVKTVAGRLHHRPLACPHGCDLALDAALITQPEARDPAMMRQLSAVAGRVLSVP